MESVGCLEGYRNTQGLLIKMVQVGYKALLNQVACEVAFVFCFSFLTFDGLFGSELVGSGCRILVMHRPRAAKSTNESSKVSKCVMNTSVEKVFHVLVWLLTIAVVGVLDALV